MPLQVTSPGTLRAAPAPHFVEELETAMPKAVMPAMNFEESATSRHSLVIRRLPRAELRLCSGTPPP